jgi:hypothetical protein
MLKQVRRWLPTREIVVVADSTYAALEFGFALIEQTVGQKLHTLTRQVLDDLLQFILTQFSQGQTQEQILQVLLPS